MTHLLLWDALVFVVSVTQLYKEKLNYLKMWLGSMQLLGLKGCVAMGNTSRCTLLADA